MTTTTEPGGAFAPLGALLEPVDMHAAGSGLSREEAVADLVVAGMYRFYGAAGFPRSDINPGGYDRSELARSLEPRGAPQPASSGLEPELASSVPEPASSGELDRIREEAQRALRRIAPAPARPCEHCAAGDAPTDRSWASVARETREALSLLGWPIIARCLPGEQDECGHGFAAHTVAHLATLMAVAEHQLDHLGADSQMVSDIMAHTLDELGRRDAASRRLRVAREVLRGCPAPAGQPQG
jgi:hypothetical protein